VYDDVLGSPKLTELHCDGARAGAVADLNGDGYDDLVIGMDQNGMHTDLNAYIYYGSPGGLSERYKVELPAPACIAVAIGDFNGDGRPDIAFGSAGKLRIFYQTKNGFLPGQFVDVAVNVLQMAAGDLNGDGCAELYVKNESGAHVFWGGKDGINPKRRTTIWKRKVRKKKPKRAEEGQAGVLPALSQQWMPKIVALGGKPHLFLNLKNQSRFIPVTRGRTLGKPLVIRTGKVRSVAVGDVNGDGHEDLVFATNQRVKGGEISWIYWGSVNGFSRKRRTALPTMSARDVAVGDLDGDGCAEIVICQERTEEECSTESLVFRCTKKGITSEPVRLKTHDAQAGFIARTSDAKTRQVIFINNVSGRARGDINSYLYFGGPDGFKPERRAEFPGWSAADGLCCDFNDDGRADILLANTGENSPGFNLGSFLYWHDKSGFDLKNKLRLPSKHAIGLACADLDCDGYLEVVIVGYFTSELLIYHGGPGGFDVKNPTRIKLEKDGIICEDPRRPFIADFNNDGWLDIVVPQCSAPTIILWGGSDGFSMKRSTFLNAGATAAANAADLNGDGWLELILGGHTGLRPGDTRFETFVYIYWGGPEGFREDRRQQLPSWKTNKISVADFNNDGVLDLFANSYHSGRTRDQDAFIFWGGKGGTYAAANRTRLFNHSSCGSIAADFNEDGWIDLAVANHKWYGNHSGHSIIWWNGPGGFSEQKQTWLPTNGPHSMLVVDPGNVMDRGPEEFYVSSAHELPEGAKVTGLEWDAELPPKTRVRGWLRFAQSKTELDRAPWQEPASLSQTGRWVQYRLALGATNSGSTPRVRQVRVNFVS